MPYFITDEADGCAGWATVKDNGDVMGCHGSKAGAIAQAVAIALAEGSTYEGERNLDELLEGAPGGGLPDNYRPATSEDVPEGRACGNCVFFNEEKLDAEGRAWCEWWEAYAAGGFYCNAWQGREARPYHDDEDEDRQEAEPAPKKDQIVGSDKNEPGSAGGAGGNIALSEATETALRNKVSEHNEAMKEQNKPDYTRTTYGQLAAVYRRGSGAFSVSHRPGQSRAAWSMARVNAYLYLLRNGRPQNPKYITDFDLLPEDHPKSTRSVESVETRDVDLTVPAYIQEAARQGLAYHAEGLSGSGVVERTLREARAMAQGDVSEDKVVRVSAWAARHRTDLDAEGARPDQDGYPTPGAVAHLLWGIPTGARYADALAWFDRKSEQVKADRSIGMEVTPVKPRTKGSDVEFRSFTGELRQEGDGNTFVGYAAMFDQPSQPLPFIERIAPGAFSKSLRNRKRDIRLFVNHDSNMVLASRNSGTLILTEDGRGLRVEATLPDTTAGRDMKELLRTGIVDKMSFGFQVDTRGDKWSDDGMARTLTSVRLFEVSIVTGFPAYEQTMAAVRSLERLSERTGMAVDELSEALDLLAEGATLPADKASLLMDAIKASSPEPEPEPANLLGLKQKQHELMGKAFAV